MVSERYKIKKKVCQFFNYFNYICNLLHIYMKKITIV